MEELYSYKNIFVEVILPLPLPKLYTYRVPQALNDYVHIGSRVVVQFGRNKILTAIIANISEIPPETYQAKYIIDLLDEAPIVFPKQMKFFEWIASYYLCNLGEVLNIAIPAGFKISSETKIQLNPHTILEECDPISPIEELVVNKLLTENTLTYNELSDVVGKKNVSPTIKSLIKQDIIILFDDVKEKYKPKTIAKIRLNDDLTDSGNLESLLNMLEKKPKQVDVILAYLQIVPITERPESNDFGMDKKLLTSKNISSSSLKTLINNGIFEEFEETISRLNIDFKTKSTLFPLSPAQNKSKLAIEQAWEQHQQVLFHGVTGSGKTEVYTHLIQDQINNGKQVLFLLPEIALTTQIVSRLKGIFGNKFGIYHSKYSDNERVEVWKGVNSGEIQFVIGVRSSIFLPFNDLGLIIIDEEHDTSYKQQEPAPRYQARDASIYLAHIHNAKILLGSATPSFESYYQAKQQKAGYVELKERFSNAQLPEIEVLSNQYTIVEKNFKTELASSIQDRLNKKEQVILFRNRRGYAPYVSCKDCNHIPNCPNCNVSLTYHQFSNELRCHYCSYSQHIPQHCPDCGSAKINPIGIGTEKIEEELAQQFPESSIQRMDYDTTRKKNSYQKIIEDFSQKRTNILVGTQMVTKGLDFDNVSLVGVYDADNMLNFPDFRAREKSFQLLTQVAGRAGRKKAKGKVIIQSATPQNPIFEYVIANDYLTLYEEDIKEREAFFYPPFSRLIKISVKNKDKLASYKTAYKLFNGLQGSIPKEHLLGPQEPLINKIRNYFLTDIVIKLPKTKGTQEFKKFLWQLKYQLEAEKEHRNSMIVIDVDPA